MISMIPFTPWSLRVRSYYFLLTTYLKKYNSASKKEKGLFVIEQPLFFDSFKSAMNYLHLLS